jgi:hypothetical protein
MAPLRPFTGLRASFVEASGLSRGERLRLVAFNLKFTKNH